MDAEVNEPRKSISPRAACSARLIAPRRDGIYVCVSAYIYIYIGSIEKSWPFARRAFMGDRKRAKGFRRR